MFGKFGRKANQRGSALVIVMIGVAMSFLMAYAAVGISQNASRDIVRGRAIAAGDVFSQMLMSLLSDQEICVNGVDGAGSGPGLQFEDAAGNASVFDPAVAASITGQSIRFRSNITSGSGGTSILLRKGQVIDRLSVRIDRLFLRTVTNTGTPTPPTYEGDLYAQLTSLNSAEESALAPRILGRLIFTLNAGNTIAMCGLSQSSASKCANIGCRYDANATGLKCFCGLPDMECPTGRFIAGFDSVTMRPICEDVLITCGGSGLGRGSGYFMAGIGTDGEPICLGIQRSQ